MNNDRSAFFVFCDGDTIRLQSTIPGTDATIKRHFVLTKQDSDIALARFEKLLDELSGDGLIASSH